MYLCALKIIEFGIMKYPIAIFLLLYGLQVNAQNSTQASFAAPFDFPLVLSGNFGEIRANHFHGGLDFKTQGVSGKKVLALSDGYITRIRVTHGSGYVLEVRYDNGYSTINRHLSGFMPTIAEQVKEAQYANESWEVSIVPDSARSRVRAGEQIAWSGNTGYSFGPHLHLDVFEDQTGDYIDPLPFFKKYLKDTRPPQVVGFRLYPQWRRGVVNSKYSSQGFGMNEKDTIRAWGVIGSAIRAYDYMNGANNRHGVHTVILTVDGEEVFRSVVDRFSEHENRMINSWTDGAYMKSFVEPGNSLRLLKADVNRGLVTIDEERNYHFRYTLIDAFGNTTRFGFVVKGVREPIEQADHKEKYIFRWDKTNYLHELGLDLLIHKGLMYDDVPLNFAIHTDSGAIAYTYQIHNERVALHRFCDIQIGVRRRVVEDTTKYYMARINDKGKLISVGGRYENGYVKARIRELGTYTVAIDTVPPKITAVNPAAWAKTGKIIYNIKEEETGVQSYRGTINGAYALFGRHNSMSGRVEYTIDPKRVKRGGRYVVEFTATDGCGNETVVRNSFNY